ncbi:hypothetical protein H4582DRAFT_1954864 [Lactarius indigo]|nr:hypothetical protein H4582DRAFT_1954864 [Lactarius indigo]
MHNGLSLSCINYFFLLVTAMLLVTTSEWMNMTRTSPSDSFPHDGNSSDPSLGVFSSNGLPSSSSPRHSSLPTHFRGHYEDRSMTFEHTSSR